MRKIDISKNAADFLMKLPPKRCKQHFTAILKLTKNPMPHDSTKLRGHSNLYRIDIGEYRLIYRFDEEHIYILLIGKRNDDDVYHHLDRR